MRILGRRSKTVIGGLALAAAVALMPATGIAAANTAPTADAGFDSFVFSNEQDVELDGTDSDDADGDPLTYSWTQTSGPSVVITDPNSALATFDAPLGPAILVFRLRVCDPDPLCDTDSVEYEVEANEPPIADAGFDDTVASEQTGVALDGSDSFDFEDDPLTYSWTQTSGPSVALSGANTATPSFDAPVGPATLTFKLKVCDPEPLCDTDTVDVEVEPKQSPTADAGADKKVASSQTGVGLDGSASSDPQGDQLTYSWTQTSGPAVALSGAKIASPSFDAPVGPTSLTFELTVCDTGPRCDTDTVVVTVNSPGSPIADAGAGQTVASAQTGVSLDGTASSDPESDPLTYSWTQTSGPAVALSGANTASPSFDAPVGPTSLTFELTVCDTGPRCDTDTVDVIVEPSTAFSFGKPKLNRKKGIAKLRVRVPAAGKLTLKKTSKVKGASKRARRPGTVNLTVKATGKAKKDLKRRGKAKVTALVTFTPQTGEPVSKLTRLTLKKKTGKR